MRNITACFLLISRLLIFLIIFLIFNKETRSKTSTYFIQIESMRLLEYFLVIMWLHAVPCISKQYFKAVHVASCISRLYLKGLDVASVIFLVNLWLHAVPCSSKHYFKVLHVVACISRLFLMGVHASLVIFSVNLVVSCVHAFQTIF